VKQGIFITVEGTEGVGKSSNIAFVRTLIERRGISCVVTREPGGTPLAEEIRALLLAPREEPVCVETELLLMFAARAQHLRQRILPALAAGSWVLSDRFTDATYAYQSGGRGVPVQNVAVLEELVQGSFRPDLSLLLDAPVDIGMARARGRGELDRFETEQTAFFSRVREHYLTRAANEPDRFRIIDAAQPLAEVQRQIEAVLMPVFALSETPSPHRPGGRT
jgi:dTMP kinase